MKNLYKYIIVLLLLTMLSAYSYAQEIRVSNYTQIARTPNSSAFIDASSNPEYNNSSFLGKGLVFPRVDLTTFYFSPTFGVGIPNNYPTLFDGMIVYNTATSGTAAAGATQGTLTMGFWYYENTSTTLTGGTWKPLSSVPEATLTKHDILSGTSPNNAATAPLVITGGAGQVVGATDATLQVNNTAPLWNANQISGTTVTGTPSAINNTLIYNAGNLTFGNANSALTTHNILTGGTQNSNAGAPPLTVTNPNNQIVGAADATFTVNNTAPIWNANQIQNQKVASTNPQNGQTLVADGSGNLNWQSAPAGGYAVSFSSGTGLKITTIMNIFSDPWEIGFGSCSPTPSIVGNVITLFGSGTLSDFAFHFPKSGTIKSLDVTYSNVVGLALGTATLQAQLYKASATSNDFDAIGSPLTVSGAIVLNALGIYHSSYTLNQQVAAGDRIILVIQVRATIAGSFTGFVDAGIYVDN